MSGSWSRNAPGLDRRPHVEAARAGALAARLLAEAEEHLAEVRLDLAEAVAEGDPRSVASMERALVRAEARVAKGGALS